MEEKIYQNSRGHAICSVCKIKITKSNFWKHKHNEYEFLENGTSK